MCKIHERFLSEQIAYEKMIAAEKLAASAHELLDIALLVVNHFANIEQNDKLTEHEQELLNKAHAASVKAKGITS